MSQHKLTFSFVHILRNYQSCITPISRSDPKKLFILHDCKILTTTISRCGGTCRTLGSRRFTRSTLRASLWAPSFLSTAGDLGDNLYLYLCRPFHILFLYLDWRGPGCTRRGRQRSWWRSAASCWPRTDGLTVSPPNIKTGWKINHSVFFVIIERWW